MQRTVRSFDEELTRLRETLLRMGTLAERQFALSLQALVERDADLARKVCADDLEIDQLEHAVNEQVVRFLALRSPVADDLRLVVLECGLQVRATLGPIKEATIGIWLLV